MREAATKSRLVRAVAHELEQARLRPGDLILLGVSGGPDSVALLHLLRELQPAVHFRLAAAHLNHRLRGAESDRDEAFVRELCARLGVEVVVDRANDLERGTANIEERARNARYGFFTRTARRLAASHLATAHHADDQAETVMLRLLRGSGLAGLGAIAPVGTIGLEGEPRALTVVRPLLRVRRSEILDYIKTIDAPFVSDSSNDYPEFLRNRIRSDLLPAIERDYAPGLNRRLAALSDEMREVDDFLSRAADAELERRCRDGALLLDGFAGLAPALAKALLRMYITGRMGSLRGISRRHIEQVHRLCIAGSPSASVALPGGWRAARHYAVVIVARCSEAHAAGFSAAGFSVQLAREGITEVEPAHFVFHSTVSAADAAPLPADLFEACFDTDMAGTGLIVRNFEPGDRIAPLGIEGRRKVQDVFVDRKVARARRLSYPVVVLNKQVAWLPGLVRGQVALVTPSTRRTLRVRARDIPNNL